MTVFDSLLSMTPGNDGISCLYRSLKKQFTKVTPAETFKSCENILGDQECTKMILEGWSTVRKHVRKPYKGLIFCPKCRPPLSDLWHGVWSCPASKDFWTHVVVYIGRHWKIALPKSPEILLFH